jgi:hypothetical protein
MEVCEIDKLAELGKLACITVAKNNGNDMLCFGFAAKMYMSNIFLWH